MSSALSISVLAALASLGAWTDIRSRNLSNWLVLATMVCGLSLALWHGGWETLLWHILHAAAGLVIGLTLFGFKFWGGGDGKFYAAVAAWFPLQEFFSLVFAISVVGLLLVLGMVAKNGWRRMAKSASTVPYGVAIGLGALLNLMRELL